jgi:RHS repeat-associated protein
MPSQADTEASCWSRRRGTSAGTTTTYGYDGDDRRVSSTIAGGGADLRYVWDPLAETGLPELALERTSAGGLVRRYVNGPLGAVSLTNSSASFYYHSDALGTVTDVTNASGVAQWKYEYEAYGAQRTATDVSGSAPENRLRFNGQYLDPETTQYHLRARQYDPASGRFSGLDPVDNALTAAYDAAYLYAGARPTVLTDPSGLDPSLAGANVNCRTNALLCVLIYAAGYQDGCAGHCVMRALQTLESRGIALDKIVAAANGKGKIVSAPDGPEGPGIYFVGGKKPLLLEAPSNPTCGFVCSIGLATTKVLGCNSNASCIAAAAMTLTPGAGVCRVGRAAVRAAKTATRAARARFAARAAARAAYRYATEANKLHHIFRPEHNLGPLVQRFGSREAVVRKMLRALKGQTPTSGVFEVRTRIAGQTVVVRGSVVNGVAKIGTAFTP